MEFSQGMNSLRIIATAYASRLRDGVRIARLSAAASPRRAR
jgi:hypothetical protein